MHFRPGWIVPCSVSFPKWQSSRAAYVCVYGTAQVLPIAHAHSHHACPVVSCWLLKVWTPYWAQEESKRAKGLLLLHVPSHLAAAQGAVMDYGWTLVAYPWEQDRQTRIAGQKCLSAPGNQCLWHISINKEIVLIESHTWKYYNPLMGSHSMWHMDPGRQPRASKEKQLYRAQREREQTSNVKVDKKSPTLHGSREARSKSVCRADHER